MSSMDLRVELPAHSHSFQVQANSSWSIQEVKEEIRRTCPGSPKVDGQRLIWRGRFLKDDEKVEEVWKSPEEARIVHLSVHPSAWVGAPPSQGPSQPTAAIPAQSQPQVISPHREQHSLPPQAIPAYPHMPTPSGRARLSYIAIKHSNALYALMNGRLPSLASEPAVSLLHLRAQDISLLAIYGWSFPIVVDQTYPSPSAPEEGVKYEQVTLDGQPYLNLVTPTAVPTPVQRHALNVLAHTYPLLPIVLADALIPPPFAPSLSSNVNPVVTNLNQRLQQLGVAPLRVVPRQNVNQNPNDPNNPAVVAEIRAIPFRALLMPLVMLTFRTLILMYFFSPSKRPLFGILLSAWILYEAWGAFRAVLGGDRPGAVDAAQNEQPQAGDVQPVAGPNQQGRAGGQGPTTPTFNRNRGPLDSFLDSLANMNLDQEEVILNNDYAHPAPSIFQKAKSFIGLFVMSLHPAMWDRRRTVLRRREGRLRTEGNAREMVNPADSEGDESSSRVEARAQLVAQHMRRPRWVREYVDRVQVTEWVDDP